MPEAARSKPILCLDFDGVIHSYSSGWQGATVIADPPVPGAMAFITRAVDHFQVAIHSSRSHQDGGIEAMRDYLLEQLAAWAKISGMKYPDTVAQFVVEQIAFPPHKPSAMVTIDDRAIRFSGIWPSIETLMTFKPWNKRPAPDMVFRLNSPTSWLRDWRRPGWTFGCYGVARVGWFGYEVIRQHDDGMLRSIYVGKFWRWLRAARVAQALWLAHVAGAFDD